jgi:hypothetical protein
MTVLIKDPTSITNWADRVLAGVGHRGSSFCDVDHVEYRPKMIVADDGVTHRFIVQELKHEGERTAVGQRRLLEALAQVPEFTVWGITQRIDRTVGWQDFRTGGTAIISEQEWRTRYQRWWNNATR